MRVPSQVRKFAQRFPSDQNIWIVGGWVRDHFMKRESQDIDMVCFGMSIEEFEAVVDGMNFKRTVGKATSNGRFSQPPVFAVEIATGFWVDVAMARIDVSTGEGKHDVEFEVGAHITKQQDAERRDFTTGCMFVNPRTNETFDPFNGRQDIGDMVIRHCSDHFGDSNERVWRMIAQVGRFDFAVAPETMEVAKAVDIASVPVEQVWRHMEKMIKDGRNIQRGFDVAFEMGIFPKVEVFQSNDPVMVIASIFNQVPDGNAFMERIGFPESKRKTVEAIATADPTGKNVRQMAVEMGKSGATVRQWATIHNQPEIMAQAEFHGVADTPERPIVTGKVMIEMGFKPGVEMGNVIKAAFEAQMVGAFSDVESGMNWVREKG